MLSCAAIIHTAHTRRFQLGTGLGLSALEWPNAGAPTVILIHGFLDLSWTWARVAEAGLADRFRLIAPDMRGHGDSDWVGAGGYYHFMDYVADLAALLDALGQERIAIAGHSMGGSIAAYFAGAFPSKVFKLALLEGLGPPEDSTALPERVALWTRAWMRARRSEPRAYPNLAAAADRLRAADPFLDPELALALAEHGTRALEDGRRVFKHDPLHATQGPYPFRVEIAQSFWRNIHCPVLLVEGELSPFRALADLEARVACLRNTTRVVIPGAGHMLQRHQPEAVARVLTEFFG
jgi:pimeloyl-ACP methyl ester carboxylesterase